MLHQPGHRQHHLGVSIHARHYWRAMQTPSRTNCIQHTVSIHARHYWRAMHASEAFLLSAGFVSIHARHYWRAMLAGSQTAYRVAVFQSTPAITGGRCNTASSTSTQPKRFQSTPAITGGRCRQLEYKANWYGRVSIHARHYWRAMPVSSSRATPFRWFQSTPAITGGRCYSSTFSGCSHAWFQSTPAITGGRCQIDALVGQVRRVSIHARHYWRAMLLGIPVCLTAVWFQSTPAITGGRCLLAAQQCGEHSSFNPRPPLLAGDAPTYMLLRREHEVSIHARHYWRAMH